MSKEISKQRTHTVTQLSLPRQQLPLPNKTSLCPRLNPVKLFRLRSPVQNSGPLKELHQPHVLSSREDYNPSPCFKNSDDQSSNNARAEINFDLASPQILSLTKEPHTLSQPNQKVKPYVPLMALRARKNRSMCSHNSIAELNLSRSNASTGTSSVQLPKGSTTLQVSLPCYQTLTNACNIKESHTLSCPASMLPKATGPRHVSLKNYRRKTPKITQEGKNAFPKDFFYSLPAGGSCTSQPNQTLNQIPYSNQPQ